MKHLLIEENHTEKDYLCVIKDGDKIFINEPLPVVDLGLTSGTKWATMNVGAENEYDAGLYFQWGDIQGYTADQVGKDKVFNWNNDNYKFGNYNSSAANKGFSKYNGVDGKTVLELEDDAAYVNMGTKFRMPTINEFIELYSNTNHQFIHDDNGKYMKFTSKTDESKFIVLPAAGSAGNSTLSSVGTYGYYWSSSLFTSGVYGGRNLGFDNDGGVGDGNSDRRDGFPVRGVLNA